MISFQGIRTRNQLYFLCLSNANGVKIEIPIDKVTGNMISLYLTGFDNKVPMVAVERGNDEPIEE